MEGFRCFWHLVMMTYRTKGVEWAKSVSVIENIRGQSFQNPFEI